MSEAKRSTEMPTDRQMLESLLSMPGSTGETYRRFHNYSPRNLGFLALQGCPPEPVATFRKWVSLERQVKKGSRAYAILRPISIRKKDEEGNPTDEFFRRFKVVRALFPYSMTEGEALPPYEPEDWSVDRALGALGITQVAFESYQGNMGGYATGREIAINPMVPYPLRTTVHEISHVQLGHTLPDTITEYQGHRGVFEAEAETTAHVTLKEIGGLDEEVASVSRGYVASWGGVEQLEDKSITKIMTASGRIIAAGYEAPAAEAAA